MLYRACLALALAAITLGACGQPASAPTAAPTEELTPTARPTATLPALAATLTPLPPATVPAGAAPAPEIGPFTFPPNVNPLTGEVVADPLVLQRRPLAIKVSNYPAVVRPQSGLGLADLVYEHYTEGGITRFTGVFLGRDAEQVGPLRSARLLDAEIALMYKAVLAYTGSSAGVRDFILRSDFFDRVIAPDFGARCPPLCNLPRPDVVETHTVFAATRDLWAEVERRGLNGPQDLPGMGFVEAPPQGGKPAGSVALDYRLSKVLWTYDPAEQRYRRIQDDAPHLDALSGEQLSAANVVVLFVNHVLTGFLEDTVGFDSTTGAGGHFSVQIQLWLTGPALIFRDGQEYDAIWVRLNSHDMMGFVDADNDPVRLKPGNTWFQVVGLNSTTTVDGADWAIYAKNPQ